jgi:hypothetical protein
MSLPTIHHSEHHERETDAAERELIHETQRYLLKIAYNLRHLQRTGTTGQRRRLAGRAIDHLEAMWHPIRSYVQHTIGLDGSTSWADAHYSHALSDMAHHPADAPTHFDLLAEDWEDREDTLYG